MSENNRHLFLTQPNYRLCLSYFCLPFLFVMLGSVVLWVAQERTGLTGWLSLLQYIYNDWQHLQGWLLALIGIPLLLCWPMAKYCWIFIRSLRIDLWLFAGAGGLTGWQLAEQFGPSYATWLLEPKSPLWLLLYGLLLLPMLGVLHLWDFAFSKWLEVYRAKVAPWLLNLMNAFKSLSTNKQTQHKNPATPTTQTSGRTQSDAPITQLDDDLFGWGIKAEAFSREALLAEDGTAFGVEAPWGTGKTSFINLCEKQWQAQRKHTVMVYRFELLNYAGSPNLIQQFVLGLVDKLQENYYLPELRSAVQGYLGNLQGAMELSGGPLKLTLTKQLDTIEEALEQIKAQLERRLPPKARLIVIIDDLDRAPPDNVRDLLFALHKCFALPRLRYVLCYDLQQLAHKAELHRQHGGDLASQTLHEFLDKFVTARVYLHTNYQGLKDYVEKQLLPQLKLRPEIPEQWRDFTVKILQKGALALLRQVDAGDQVRAINSKENDKQLRVEQHHIHWGLLGDIRKLKWLYNQMCLCWQQGLDLDKHDFDARDLVRLLLLQQEFPIVFRSLQAQAHSGEYLYLSVKNADGNYAKGAGLDGFINQQKEHYEQIPWQKNAVEVLLLGLFDPKVPSNDGKPIISNRAARGYRLPEYFNLLLQEQIPSLHSSGTYRIWLSQQWYQQGVPLEKLLKDEALKPHKDVKENWQDEHEYALWEILLGPFNRYSIEQQRELLTEYLKALPRFAARKTMTPRRFAMASLLGLALSNLLAHNNFELVQGLLKQAWFDNEYAMLSDKHNDKALLGWQDAMQVYNELLSYNSELKTTQLKAFWDMFTIRYLNTKVAWQDVLPTPEMLQGGRKTVEQLGWQPEMHWWLVSMWKSLWRLCEWQGDKALLQKVADWLFISCWGEPQPKDEQLTWWLDFLLSYSKKKFDDPTKLELPPSLQPRMQAYAQKHKGEIETVRLKQTHTIDHGYRKVIKADVLQEALTKLDELSGDEGTQSSDSAPSEPSL